jgi:multiple sugar transport system permease protein
MSAPATVFNLITTMIATFQIFATAYVVSGGNDNLVGNPQGSLMFYIEYIWQSAFSYLKFGYASAMAWILFLIIMTFTAVLLIVSRRLVYYEGEGR